MDSPSDEHLVLRAQGGDLEAFNDLVARREPELFRFLRRVLGNREDALDLRQETLVKAYLHIRALRQGGRFKTWLYQIALNLCRDRLRSPAARRATRAYEEGGPVELSAARARTETHAPDQHRVRRALMDDLTEILTALPEEQSTAILLREYQGLTSDEIAEITGVPAATVRTRIFYGLKSVRQRLRQRGHLPDGED